MHVVTFPGDIAPHAVTNLHYRGPTDGCILTVICRGKRFHVTIFPEDLQEHQHEYERLIRALSKSSHSKTEFDSSDPQEELEDWALRPFHPIFQS